MRVICIIFSLVLIIFKVVTPQVEEDDPDIFWRDYLDKVPDDAVLSHLDENNKKVYIGQVLLRKEGSIYSGPLYNGNPSMTITGLPSSNKLFRINNKNLQVLCTWKPEKFQWIPTSLYKLTKIPYHIIEGSFDGKSGNVLYIGKTVHKNRIKLGIVDPNQKVMYYFDNQLGYSTGKYEVFIYNITTEIYKSKGSESRRMVDITRDKPIKVAVRVVVPVRDHPKFNFVGKLLGPKGNSLKRLQEDTMCKMAVLGRGSMKDRHKEEELRASGDPKFQHLSEELHVEISAFATPAEAHARIAYALAEVRRFLVPDYNDDIRQEQMWEMQVLSSQRNNNKGDEASGGSSSGPEFGGDDRLSADVTELGPESPQDEHPALRGIQSGTPSSADTTGNSTPANGGQPSPTNGVGGGPGPGGAVVGGRKRPLLAGGPRTSMTPTKRTVMSLLARARAAQAKQLPATFQRGTPDDDLEQINDD